MAAFSVVVPIQRRTFIPRLKNDCLPSPQGACVALDTSVVRHAIAGDAMGALFQNLQCLRGQFWFSLAFHSFVEILEDLIEGSIPWDSWCAARGLLSGTLDGHRPILPAFGDLISETRRDGWRHAALGAKRRRAMWLHLINCSSTRDLRRPALTWDDNGQEMHVPFDVAAPGKLLQENRDTLRRLLAPIARQRARLLRNPAEERRREREAQAAGDNAPATMESIKVSISQLFERHYGPSMVKRLDCFVAMHSRYIYRVNNRREPYNPQRRRNKNDGTDWFQTMVLGLPAFLVTNDTRLVRNVAETHSVQAKYVMTLETFMEKVDRGQLPILTTE